MSSIQTAFGPKKLIRRFGPSLEYYETDPTPLYPRGEWWVRAPGGFVPVPASSPRLQLALWDAR